MSANSEAMNATNNCQTLTKNAISNLIQSEVNKLKSELVLNPVQCQILLMKFKWNSKNLMEAYNAVGSKKKFLIDNGVSPAACTQKSGKKCNVCWSGERLFTLACGHAACKTCWGEYFRTKIDDGSCLIECMDSNCKLIARKVHIQLIDLELSKRFDSLIIQDYVNAKSQFTKCINCNLFVKFTSPGSVVCPCGSKFCSFCKRTPHSPATCLQWSLWRADTGTQQWIHRNTKNCPKCLVSIEKNGGCIQMTCRNKGCRHVFCWVCGDGSQTHGYWTCSRFNFTQNLDIHADFRSSNTFQNQFNLYQNDIRQTRDLINCVSSTPSNQKVIESLLETRQFLANSVIFASYLEDKKYSEELAMQQRTLERKINDLETLLKNNSDEEVLLERANNLEQCRVKFQKFCDNRKHYEDMNRRTEVHHSYFNIATLGAILSVLFMILMTTYFLNLKK